VTVNETKNYGVYFELLFLLYIFSLSSSSVDIQVQENKRQINPMVHISCNKHSFLLNLNRYKQIEIKREREYVPYFNIVVFYMGAQ